MSLQVMKSMHQLRQTYKKFEAQPIDSSNTDKLHQKNSHLDLVNGWNLLSKGLHMKQSQELARQLGQLSGSWYQTLQTRSTCSPINITAVKKHLKYRREGNWLTAKMVLWPGSAGGLISYHWGQCQSKKPGMQHPALQALLTFRFLFPSS